MSWRLALESLRRFLDPLGDSWEALEAPWTPLGGLLDPLGGLLDPLRRPLGALLEGSWSPPGPSWALFAALELIWELLTSAFERSGRPLEVQMASQRPPKGLPKGTWSGQNTLPEHGLHYTPYRIHFLPVETFV